MMTNAMITDDDGYDGDDDDGDDGDGGDSDGSDVVLYNTKTS